MTKNNLKVVKTDNKKQQELKEKNKSLEAAISQIDQNFGKNSFRVACAILHTFARRFLLFCCISRILANLDFRAPVQARARFLQNRPSDFACLFRTKIKEKLSQTSLKIRLKSCQISIKKQS